MVLNGKKNEKESEHDNIMIGKILKLSFQCVIYSLIGAEVVYVGFYFMKYCIDNNISPSYSMILNEIYIFTMTIFVFKFVALIIQYLKDDREFSKQETPTENIAVQKKDKNPVVLKRMAIHEAGHAVVAEHFNIPVLKTTVCKDVSSKIGGYNVLDMPEILTPDLIRQLIIIKYGGVVAETVILGNPSTGCMGSDIADINAANKFLNSYVILTDESISLTGLETDLINQKVIMLSKELELEAKQIVMDNISKIKIMAEELLKNSQ